MRKTKRAKKTERFSNAAPNTLFSGDVADTDGSSAGVRISAEPCLDDNPLSKGPRFKHRVIWLEIDMYISCRSSGAPKDANGESIPLCDIHHRPMRWSDMGEHADDADDEQYIAWLMGLKKP